MISLSAMLEKRTRAEHASRPARESLSKRLGSRADAIRARDGYACAYCHSDDIAEARAGRSLHLDHLVPAAAGGSDKPTNLVLACHRCNSVRHDMSLKEWSEYSKDHLKLTIDTTAIEAHAKQKLPTREEEQSAAAAHHAEHADAHRAEAATASTPAAKTAHEEAAAAHDTAALAAAEGRLTSKERTAARKATKEAHKHATGSGQQRDERGRFAAKIAKARSSHPLDRERELVVRARELARRAAQEFLAGAGKKVADAARQFGKAAGSDDDHPVAGAAASIDYAQLEEALLPALKEVARDAAARGVGQVTEPIEEMLAQADELAIAWAQERAGELVTQIDETTREYVRELVTKALEEGWTNAELADSIEADEAFGSARAEMIARTETSTADIQGNTIGWQQSGVVAQKQWTVADAGECDDCQELDGTAVDLDDEFPGGGPPLHPNCRCDVLPVLAEE